MAGKDPRERVARLLAGRDAGASVPEIAAEVLRVRGLPPAGIATIVRALLGPDPRFVERDGRWRLVDPAARAGETLAEEAPAWGAEAADDLLAVALGRDPRGPLAVARFREGRPSAVVLLQASLPMEAAALAHLCAPPPPLVVAFDARATLLAAALAPDAQRVSLRELARTALGKSPRTLQALAATLRIGWPDPSAPPAEYAELVGRAYLELRARAAQAPPSPAGDALRDAREHRDRLVPERARARLPSAPGVYLFRARNGRALYVGKAKNLRRRIASHFTTAAARREGALHAASARITYEVCGSEAEALLREFQLISRFRPRFNTQRDVHRRPVWSDAILLLPSPSPSHARLYAFRADGSWLDREVPRRRGGGAILREAASLFFPSGARPPRRPRSTPQLIAILDSWLRANRDRVCAIDPRHPADRDDLLRILREHLADPDLFFDPTQRR